MITALTFPIDVVEEPRSVFEVRFNILCALAQNVAVLTAGERGEKRWRGYLEDGRSIDDDFPVLTSIDELNKAFASGSPSSGYAFILSIDGIEVACEWEIKVFGIKSIQINLPKDHPFQKDQLLEALHAMRARVTFSGNDSVRYKQTRPHSVLTMWQRMVARLGLARRCHD